jgi:Tol biopolymer transport system component
VAYLSARGLVTVRSTEPEADPESYDFGRFPACWERSLAWSPNGTYLAWVSPVTPGVDGTREGREVRVCVAELASGDLRAVGEPVRMPVSPLTWLPDSQTLLFTAFLAPLQRAVPDPAFPGIEVYGGRGQVCLFDVASGEIRALTEGKLDDRWPVLRPQGDLIAFERGGNIWVMAADGTRQRPLTESGRTQCPQWSPDGQAVAFYREDRSDFGGALWIAELESGRLVKVASEVLLPLLEIAFSWTWRPDSRGLLFCSGGDLFATERRVYALPRLLTREEAPGIERLTPAGRAEHGMILAEASDGLLAVTLETRSEEKQR